MRFSWLVFGCLSVVFGVSSLIETPARHLNIDAVLITNGILLLVVAGLLLAACFGPWDFHTKSRKQRSVEAWENDLDG